jgi:hypothetical protein
MSHHALNEEVIYRTNLLAARWVILSWLAGWYLKIGFYFPYLMTTGVKYPLAHPLFPPFLLNPLSVIVAYWTPLLVVPLFFFYGRRALCLSSVCMVSCAAVMNLHINTCNDATFVTSFWVAVWLFWFTWHCRPIKESFPLHAKVLAQSLIGVIFLAGTVGKLTPEFWSGEVMDQIFLRRTDLSPLGKILTAVPPGARQALTAWVSKMIIVTEAVLALSPFLPYRFVVVTATVVFGGISLFSTWRIFSVLGCLLGMLWACLLLEKNKDGLSREAGESPSHQIKDIL